MRSALRRYDTKKDLLKAPRWLRKDYRLFKRFLNIDGRFKPSTSYNQFKLYVNDTALPFKSDGLSFNLDKTGLFSEQDKYKSSSKIVSVVTNSMYKTNVTLLSLKSKFELIDISYKNKSFRKTVRFRIQDLNNLEFIQLLPRNYYININGTSYNKNGLDFIYDYSNQSNDFSQNLNETVENQELIIYKR